LHLQIISQSVLYILWKPVLLPNWNTTLHCITDAISLLSLFASLWSTNYNCPVYPHHETAQELLNRISLNLILGCIVKVCWHIPILAKTE
jgi:hypothetical protein